MLTAGAEPLYREMFGGQISLGNLFTLRGLGTKRFFKGAILGITLTGIFIAYQTAFYIVAYRFGAWSPADVPYTDMLNTKFPWAFVLFGGFLPAVSEEFLFRMFAIPFLKKATRSMAVAIVLAGFIWGFGHSGYPQQPFYIRGMEVGIGGIALGIIMQRFGILTTLVWHYSVDAMYSAMLLVRSESLYYKLSGLGAAGIMLLPIAIALIAYWRRGGFLPEDGLLNRDDVAEPAPVVEAPQPEEVRVAVAYRPLSARTRWIAALALVAGLATLAIPVVQFAERPRFQIGPDEARRSSDAFLKTLAMDPAAFRYVTYPSTHWDGSDPMAAKYFLERLPLPAVSALFERNRPMRIWMTRYFKPLDQEEITVAMQAETGRVTGFTHSLPEDRPGADLPADRAQAIASQFAASHGWDTSTMELKESDSEKKKARRDYEFAWDARPGDPRNVGEAKWRVAIDVDGDQVTEGHAFWKLPEAYERVRGTAERHCDHHRRGQDRSSRGTDRVGDRTADPRGLGWKNGAMASRDDAGASGHSADADRSAAEDGYRAQGLSHSTCCSRLSKQCNKGKLGMSVVFGFLVLAAAAAVVTTFFPEALAALKRTARATMALDALAAIAAGAGLSVAVHQLQALLVERFHAVAMLNVAGPDPIAGAAPALAAITGALRGMLSDTAILGLLALLVQRVKNRWPLGVQAVLGWGLKALPPGEVARWPA